MAYPPEEKAGMQRDLALYVGMQIKLRRTEARMTIADLSELTGITPAALCKIERGTADVKLSTLALIRSALALDITITPIGRVVGVADK